MAKKKPKARGPVGNRRAMAMENARWARRSGKVRVGRIEDLPTDHPARQGQKPSRRVAEERRDTPRDMSSKKEGKAELQFHFGRVGERNA